MNTQERFALVLEGGGYRGIFTAGVVDVLIERGLSDGFASVWGTSAGAMNAVNVKSRQAGRMMRVILAFRDDRRFMSFMSLAKTGNIASSEFIYDEVQNKLDPFDYDEFFENPLELYAVASDVVFGTAAYLPVRRADDFVAVRASASLPVVSRMVEFGGHRYLDGGTTDAVAFDAALGLESAAAPLPEAYEPAARAVVVLTRDRNYQKTSSSQRLALRSHLYDDYPYYLEALRTRHMRYNAQRERLWQLEEKGQVLVIAPEKTVEISLNEHNGAALLDLYLQGRRQTEARLAEIDAFLHPEDAE